MLDWRNKPKARAEVQGFIRDLLDELAPAYTTAGSTARSAS